MAHSVSTTVVTAAFEVDRYSWPPEKVVRKVCLVFVKLAQRFHLRVGKSSEDGAVVCCYADDDSRHVLFSSAKLEVLQAVCLDVSSPVPVVTVQLTWHHPGTGTGLEERGYRKRRHFIELFTHAWRKLLTRLLVESEQSLVNRDGEGRAIQHEAEEGLGIDKAKGNGNGNGNGKAKDVEKFRMLMEKRKKKEAFLDSKEVRQAVAPFNYEQDEQKEKRKISTLKQMDVDVETRRKVAPFNYDPPIRLSKRMKGEDEGTVRKAVAPFNYPD